MPEKHMVWGHGARFVQGYFWPRFGDFWVQFGLKKRFLLIFVKNLYRPGEAILAKNHMFFKVFGPGALDFGAQKAPQNQSEIVEN